MEQGYGDIKVALWDSLGISWGQQNSLESNPGDFEAPPLIFFSFFWGPSWLVIDLAPWHGLGLSMIVDLSIVKTSF